MIKRSTLSSDRPRIASWLEQHTLNFQTHSGNEVSFNCPACGESKSHCWFNTKRFVGYCFRCGKSFNLATLTKLLKKKLELSIEINHRYSDVSNIQVLERREADKMIIEKVDLPTFSKPVTLFSRAVQYLQQRRYDAQLLERYYGLQYCYFGENAGRIIFPIIEDGVLVAWQGRTIYDDKLRYMQPPGSKLRQFFF